MMRPRHLQPIRTGLDAEIARAQTRVAAAQGQIASLQRAASGDTSDRLITVDALWEERNGRTLGAAVSVYQDRAMFFPMNAPGPEFLYAAALWRGWAKVCHQTGGTSGLTIRLIL